MAPTLSLYVRTKCDPESEREEASVAFGPAVRDIRFESQAVRELPSPSACTEAGPRKRISGAAGQKGNLPGSSRVTQTWDPKQPSTDGGWLESVVGAVCKDGACDICMFASASCDGPPLVAIDCSPCSKQVHFCPRKECGGLMVGRQGKADPKGPPRKWRAVYGHQPTTNQPRVPWRLSAVRRVRVLCRRRHGRWLDASAPAQHVLLPR